MRPMRPTHPLLAAPLAALAAGLLLAGPLSAPGHAETQAGNEDARALLEQTREAYREIEQYRSTIEMRIEQQMHGQSHRETVEMELAYDRPNDRLLLTDEQMHLVAGEGTVRLRLRAHTERHFESELAEPMTLDALLGPLPTLSQPVVLPNLAFLLADDPLEIVTTGQADTLRVRDAGGADEPRRLAMQTQMGELTLEIDVETQRIDRASLELDMERLGQGQPGVSATLEYHFDSQLGEAAGLDAEVFAFDTDGSRAVASLTALQPDPAEAMVGQGAPSFEVSTLEGEAFSMSEDAAPITVLEFWATWCGPCRHALPEAEGVHEWAQEHHGDAVAVYSVNVGESEEVARPYWDDMGLKMPVLMDTDSSVQREYGGRGLPYTVIVADGRIAYVQSGYVPGMGDTLKEQITELLGPQ